MKDFLNRIRKMAKHHGKWARRQGYESYRIYDNDVPGYPYIIEFYKDHLNITQYEKNHLPQQEVQDRNDRVLELLQQEFNLDKDKIHFRSRRRQSGTGQYQKSEGSSKLIIREKDLKFLVDLDSYLDTGLFLDHRKTREMVKQESQGKSVLNLFSYTCSFSVYAAAGGARRVVSVDLSNTYLDWGKENFGINNLDPGKYEFLREDILQWLKQPARREFDIIVLDPPTFSNSKKMDSVLDMDRDHPFLITESMKRLNKGGVLYFSNNFRKFQMSPLLEDKFSIKEISQQTIPPDFRDKKIHRAYKIYHKEFA